jgi:hypothetical protein
MPGDFLSYKFQTKIKLNSSTATLRDFLKGRTPLEERDMVLRSLKSFWLIPAMQEAGQFNQSEITRHALLQILSLQQQITFTCLSVNLDPKHFLTLPCAYHQHPQAIDDEGDDFNLEGEESPQEFLQNSPSSQNTFEDYQG